MLLDLLGFHRQARKADTRSKIRNLLKGTAFESNRTGSYLEFENPKRIFDMLEHTDVNEVWMLRNQLELQFDSNMSELLKKISNGKEYNT